MNIKIILTTLTFLFSIGITQTVAQGNLTELQTKIGAEKIHEARVSYITNKIDLTEKEAVAFWPIYNAFIARRKELKDKVNQLREEASSEGKTKKQIESSIAKQFKVKQNILSSEKYYHAKLKKVLPIQKLNKLYGVQENFELDLIKKVRDQKEKRLKHIIEKRKYRG